jgi:hypothetical protein
MNDKHRKNHVGRIVEVHWLDAWWDTKDTRAKDWKTSCPMVTYGLCVRDIPGGTISVSHEHDRNANNHRGVTHIPYGIVEQVIDYGSTNA